MRRLVIDPHRLERLRRRRPADDPDVVRAHHPARGVRVVLQQLAQLALLARRHQVQHWEPAFLVELAQQVGRIVRRHAVEHLRRFFVGPRAEELGAMLFVELLENVGRQLHVLLDRVEDLLTLLVRSTLHEVCDLRGMQAAQQLQRHEQLGRRDVGHERLHVSPVQQRVAAQVGPGPPRDQTAQHRLRAAVDTQQPPLAFHLGEHQVMRPHEPAARDLDQMPAQHVGRQQHLSAPALEVGHVERVGIQPYRLGLELVDELEGDEDLLAGHGHLQPGDRRVAGVAEPRDEVGHLADLLGRGVEDGAPQQLRHHHAALLHSRYSPPRVKLR